MKREKKIWINSREHQQSAKNVGVDSYFVVYRLWKVECPHENSPRNILLLLSLWNNLWNIVWPNVWNSFCEYFRSYHFNLKSLLTFFVILSFLWRSTICACIISPATTMCLGWKKTYENLFFAGLIAGTFCFVLFFCRKFIAHSLI